MSLIVLLTCLINLLWHTKERTPPKYYSNVISIHQKRHSSCPFTYGTDVPSIVPNKFSREDAEEPESGFRTSGYEWECPQNIKGHAPVHLPDNCSPIIHGSKGPPIFVDFLASSPGTVV